MATFNFVPTTSGKALFAHVQAGAVLIPTKFQIGTGTLSADSTAGELTALISPFKEFAVSEKKATPDGKCIFGGVFTNQDITDEFYLREIGLFAKAEYRDEEGNVTQEVAEVLFIVGNAGDTADLYPGASESSSLLERKVRIPVYIGSDAAVDVSMESGTAISQDEKGAAMGVATLDENGTLDMDQWPSLENMGAFPTAGGTMKGPVSMGGNKITNLAAPTGDMDAVTKMYVDAIKLIAQAALARTGGTMTGDIAMGGNKITGLATPTANADAVTKAYADAIKKIASAALPKSGGTMTGDIAMGGNKITGLGTPTADADAVTKAYADAIKKVADAALPKTGGTVSGNLVVDGTMSAAVSEDYTGFRKVRKIGSDLFYLDIGIGHVSGKGASISLRLLDSKFSCVARIDAWQNGTFTFTIDQQNFYDIFDISEV